LNLENDLAELRVPLLRFAQLQLRESGAAEDVVSETFLAVLEKPAAFEGRSSLRTYATEQTVDEAVDALFAADGHYRAPQPAWQQPETALESAQLQQQLQGCIERLPERLARVFMMREWLEKEVEDICGELNITANHCGVLLYRARMQLRMCLQRHGRGAARPS
jgi:RNA polymerase sigma-70 factor, ECF subfamily